MPRQEYQRELDGLQNEVVEMIQLVLRRLNTATTVLADLDAERAQTVIEGDHEVNERYLDLEDGCIRLLALQQPVAGDLRFIAASFKIITDLERIGDLATNIAGYGRAAEHPIQETVDVLSIAEKAEGMVIDAMHAFQIEDASLSRIIADLDSDLDEQCREASERIVRELLSGESSIGADSETEQTLDDVFRALLTIRDLERIGDHAENICARTVYMIENDDELIY